LRRRRERTDASGEQAREPMNLGSPGFMGGDDAIEFGDQLLVLVLDPGIELHDLRELIAVLISHFGPQGFELSN
jgi:hypothetical protein